VAARAARTVAARWMVLAAVLLLCIALGGQGGLAKRARGAPRAVKKGPEPTLESRAMDALAPLPPALSSLEAGSFAEYTLRRRLPGVLARVEQHTGKAGAELLAAIQHGSLADVAWTMPCPAGGEDSGHEAAEGERQQGREGGRATTRERDRAWERMLNDWTEFCSQQEAGAAWAKVAPAISMESLFYRKVLEAAGYFADQELADPFLSQKEAALYSAAERLEAISGLALACGRSGQEGEGEGLLLARDTCATALLHASLWGNRADLSLEPDAELVDGIPEEAEHAVHSSLVQELRAQNGYLLADDSSEWLAYVDQEGGLHRLDFVTDNVGLELGADMALISFLLETDMAQRVTVHLKFHPTFVSDVTTEDWLRCLAWLAAGVAGENGRELARRLQEYAEEGRLVLTRDVYWTGPRLFWELPERWAEERFGGSGTTIFKGDANYRKLVGDRKWQETDRSFGEVMSYFPSPVLALRTAKAEIVAGVDKAVASVAAAHDEHWMTNGRWGAVQFARNLLE